MGREPARNRKKPQAHSRLATLLPRLMSYSATQMTNAVEAKPTFVTVGDNPARAFGMEAADRARALAIKAGVEPARQVPTRPIHRLRGLELDVGPGMAGRACAPARRLS